MDIDNQLEEIHLVTLLKKAYSGNKQAQHEYNDMMREAHEKRGGVYFWHRELYLYYLRERVLRELYEEYIVVLEKHCVESVLFRVFNKFKS